MASELAKLTGPWSTDVLPTQTTLTHIDPAGISGLISTLISASNAFPTITKNIDLYYLAQNVKGAQASLKVISAQHYIATATATQDFPRMTEAIWNATMELQELEKGFNLYQMELSTVANMLFAGIFAVLLFMYTGLLLWKHYVYFGLCFVLGTGLEFAGYLARVMAIDNYSDQNPYLCQIICLTLAPAFVMAGIYYLLAQLSVIYGHKFSRLKPLTFSYIFIFCDISSLMIQAAGGGLAAIKVQELEDTTAGTYIMLAGIAFQVFSMTLFLWFFFDFIWQIYFRASPNVHFSMQNLFRLLFQTTKGRILQNEQLFAHYNQKYSHIWSRRLFGYYPFVIILGVAFIYIRCVYRLIELSEGWTGYLITREHFVMTLDGLQVLLTCILYIPFHPGFVFGKSANVSMRLYKDKSEKESGAYPKKLSIGSYTYSSFDDKLSADDTDSFTSHGYHHDLEMPISPYFVQNIAVKPPPVPTKPIPTITPQLQTPTRVHPSERISLPLQTRAPPLLTPTRNQQNENGNQRQSPNSPQPKKQRHKWFGLVHDISKETKLHNGVVTDPYMHAAETSERFNGRSPQHKTFTRKLFNKPTKIIYTDDFASVNPYSPSAESKYLVTSGPYEHSFELRVTRPSSEQYPSTAFIDLWRNFDTVSDREDSIYSL